MIELNDKYWTDRYKQNETGWDTGGITTPLREYFDQLGDKDLKILIPGAGNAYEAEYLVNNGFKRVYVCDLSPVPLQNLKDRCPKMPGGHLILGDFFKMKENQFDLVVEQTFFCAINPSLRKEYFDKVFQLLMPGGKLAGVLFDDKLNTEHPPFGGNKKEYLTYIPKDFDILHLDPCYNSIKPREGRELFIELQKKQRVL